MFSYTLPCGGFKTLTKITETGISFDPPVYEQRYCAAIQILEDARWLKEIKKVTEFGCAEMRLFQLMRRIETIENILQVDVDQETLKTHLNRTNPLVSDFIRERQAPLQVQVLLGSVADAADELRNTDAVIALELIEHVYEDVLAKIPGNIFGFMQPKIVIFSTPNSEFNEIFTRFSSLLPNGFRHHDHKFEWTREEFKSWCLGITEQYSNYMFALLGVGDPPQGDEAVGHVSQIALFVRKDTLGVSLTEPLTIQPALDTISNYQSLHTVDFPYNKDTRTPEEKIWAEIETQLYRCTRDEDNYDTERCVYKLSLDELARRLEYLGATRELLEKLLQLHKKMIENDFVLIEEEQEEEEEIECSDWENPIYEQSEPGVPIEGSLEEENWDV
ncbi:small RNA 2'-O-methyltransferase [Drosophila hydei]|uniref:Small RNA 2'-O-methyltransferase n=1 Tax=Drosophila hydei TaxID=7224 RepID=A0A6J1M507_DROHY|nr:small RNA 2'-O-methyltransferase [Drosophila hydei]